MQAALNFYRGRDGQQLHSPSTALHLNVLYHLHLPLFHLLWHSFLYLSLNWFLSFHVCLLFFQQSLCLFLHLASLFHLPFVRSLLLIPFAIHFSFLLHDIPLVLSSILFRHSPSLLLPFHSPSYSSTSSSSNHFTLVFYPPTQPRLYPLHSLHPLHQPPP